VTAQDYPNRDLATMILAEGYSQRVTLFTPDQQED
jgi:hypothetical protein